MRKTPDIGADTNPCLVADDAGLPVAERSECRDDLVGLLVRRDDGRNVLPCADLGSRPETGSERREAKQ